VLAAGSVFQTVFGLFLMLGIFVAPAALALVLFTIAASWMFLNVWSLSGPEREAAIYGLLSNVAIVGGLLIAGATAK
jgi:putative oxidoreductase